MTKRFFFKAIMATGMTGGIGSVVFGQERPNILWITIEDTSPQFIGCYGNKDARTSNIDRLANTGIRFLNAFSTGTVCSPSRSAIITGVKTYKLGTGNHRSEYPIPDFIKGFPYYLQQAGYYTSNNKKTDYNVANAGEFTKTAWNDSSDKAGWWNRKSGQPFFSVFNFMDSHQSRTMTWPYKRYRQEIWDKLSLEECIGDNDFSMPPFFKDSPAMRKQVARVYNSLRRTDDEIGQLLRRLDNDHLRDSTIIFFYADHGEGIPRGKTNGIDLGYRVPFIIWVPERYKDLSPWGMDGVTTDELVDFEDLAPTVISLAGGEVPAHMKGRILMGKERSMLVDHLVLSADRSDNGIDLVRNVTNGKYMYSRNFMPFMPEVRYINYMEIGEIKQQMREDLFNGELNSMQRSLFQPRSPESLYDIENDPWETINLVNDPTCQPVLEEMKQHLKNEVLHARDVLFLPEYEIDLISKRTTPYEFRLDDKNYPINDIYNAAFLSGFRGRDIAQKQIALLKSPNKIVRYWAAVGLRCQSREDLAPFTGELDKALQDDYPPVAITIAATIWTGFSTELAGETLKRFCADDNWHINLMTINYLLYANNKKPFVNAVKQTRNAAKDKPYEVRAACDDFLNSLKWTSNSIEAVQSIGENVPLCWFAKNIPSRDGWTVSGIGSEFVAAGQGTWLGSAESNLCWVLSQPDGTTIDDRKQMSRNFSRALTTNDAIEVLFKYNSDGVKWEGGFNITLYDNMGGNVLSFYKNNNQNDFSVWNNATSSAIRSWSCVKKDVVPNQEYLYRVEAAGPDSSILRLFTPDRNNQLMEIWNVTVSHAPLPSVFGIKIGVYDRPSTAGGADTLYINGIEIKGCDEINSDS
ncbi:MAG: sulfatase-like hydrolase/transferase [Kiritimatiellales bacterium]